MLAAKINPNGEINANMTSAMAAFFLLDDLTSHSPRLDTSFKTILIICKAAYKPFYNSGRSL